MKPMKSLIVLSLLAFLLTACGAKNSSIPEQLDPEAAYTVNTKISDVINDPAFAGYGRLIFPVDTGYFSGNTLGALRLTWYNYIDPDKTVCK